MPQNFFQCDLHDAKKYLHGLISKSVEPGKLEWLEKKIALLTNSFSEREFFLTFSATPRFLGKEKLHIDKQDLESADQLRKGFCPENFSTDRTARILFTLCVPFEDQQRFLEMLQTVFSIAEVSELVALYSALPLLPHADLLSQRCAEGIRSNMTVVFESIALNNPYPADFLDEDAWNQMVLKAVFTERPLYKIYGIDKRANENLGRMLSDYAHERWAAGRYVTPELWRPVGPFINDKLMGDFDRLFKEENGLQKEAAALACYGSKFSAAQNLLKEHPELLNCIDKKEVTWNSLGEKWLASKT